MNEWYRHLQERLKQAVDETYAKEWQHENDYISYEIRNIKGKFNVERFEKGEKELRVYAHIGKSVTDTYELRLLIYEALYTAAENFLVLVPLHTPSAWQFWFLTGTQSHGHVVRIIIERENHPHIQDRWRD